MEPSSLVECQGVPASLHATLRHDYPCCVERTSVSQSILWYTRIAARCVLCLRFTWLCVLGSASEWRDCVQSSLPGVALLIHSAANAARRIPFGHEAAFIQPESGRG